MVESKSFKNEIQQSFYNLMPYMHYFFEDEIMFTMSDTEKFLEVVNSENINTNAKPGDPLRPGGAAYECIKAQKPVSTIVAKEIFGVEVKAIGIPVRDKENNIIGSVVLGKSLKRHYEILDMSKQLSEALSQISESVNQILLGVQNAVKSNDKIISYVDEANENSKAQMMF